MRTVARMIGPAFLLLVVLASPLAAQNGRLPIMTWPGPDAALLDAETLRLVAEAGFSVNMSFLGGREANIKALDLALAAGLKIMVQDDRISKLVNETAPSLETLKSVVADYKRHPALFGYFVVDEPNASKFERLGAVVARLKALDPGHPAYINLFPTYANETQLGTATYEEHVARYLGTVKPPFLSFDHYPVTSTGLRPDYYRNLEIVRMMALERGLDLWAFTLVTPHAVYPPPTEGHVRLQLWSDIAYGAKALQYFTFATPEGTDSEWGSGLIDKAGRPGPAYALAREINAEIRRVEKLILHWKSLGVYHTGFLPAGARAPDAGCPVLGAEGGPLLIGVLSDEPKTYVVLVNKDYERAVSVVVRFAPGLRELTEVAVRGRPAVRLNWPPDHGEHVCRLEFDPGEARIFRLNVLSRPLAPAGARPTRPVMTPQVPAPPPPPPAMKVPPLTVKGRDQVIDVGGRRLHAVVYGSGRPTVVLASGFQAPQSYWNPVVNGIAAAATVVTYDRAGYGKSERGDLPVHGRQSAADLHVLLEALGVPRDYLLVGHSYGGRIVRLFASAYPENTAGLILEEAGHEDLPDAQLEAITGKDRETLAAMIAPYRTKVPHPRTETDYMAETIEQLRGSGPLPRVPLVVITSATRGSGLPAVFSPEGQAKLAEVALAMQKKLVELIPGGEHILVDGAGHNVHLDKPEAVIAPIRSMIARIKGQAARLP